MIVCPVVVGAGKRFFPDHVPLKLELVNEPRFRHGVVVLGYNVRDCSIMKRVDRQGPQVVDRE
jgi:hypothetical protein